MRIHALRHHFTSFKNLTEAAFRVSIILQPIAVSLELQVRGTGGYIAAIG
jgi:hypothetical protein